MRKFGPLNALDAFNNESAPWVVIFHGYGADAFDLFPLHEVIPTQKPLNWIFPQGPLEVPVGPMWNGRAWWKIDVDKIQQAAASGVDRDLSLETSDELAGTRKKISAALETLKVPWDQIILGGFSQGAMLAVDTFLHAPKNPRGLILWSGAMSNKIEWKARTQSEEFQNRLKEKPAFSYFQSHGLNDSVLTLKNGQRLEGFLQSLGMKGKMLVFPGAHEIPPAAVIGTSQYLASL
jgi:phospholipase/carboxylesterase